VLDLEEPVSADLAGHLHVARALVRSEAMDAPPPASPAQRGRPRGWRYGAARALATLGLRQATSRALLAMVNAAVRARPLTAREAPYVRVAFRAPAGECATLLRRMPIPPRFGRATEK
jgi:hypothetical protein